MKKLDKAVSQFVIKRDKSCVTCGSDRQLGCGHLFSRVAYSTRWNLKNCNAQCWGCNYKHEFDPYPYQEWFKNKYGHEEYHDLHRAFVTPKKYSDKDLLLMIEALQ